MASTVHRNAPRNQLLILGPPFCFMVYEKQFSETFEILNPHESSLPRKEFLTTYARDVQALLCSGGAGVSIDSDLLDQLPALRFVACDSSGVDHIDLSECRRRGISVANAGEVYSADVADLAVGLVLDVLRKISAADSFVREELRSGRRSYVYPLLGTKVGSKRVGIVGLGSIGHGIAKRLEGFGCSISYFSRNKKPNVSYPFYPDVHKLALNTDVLVVCCSLNDQTRRLINREVLSALGEKGVVVNVARGAVIDEAALVGCLKNGDIGGAGLDVFEEEPDVPQELLAMDNVVVSPHAGFSTEEAFRGVFELMLGNLHAFFSNHPPLSPLPL